MCGISDEGGACAENSADEFGEAENNIAAYADPGAALRLVIMDVRVNGCYDNVPP
ncbi:MAG: hypothetical protein QF662_01455 [Phycisphaerae bacterium]|nr:hypothetical protein [Phycisphaerae bacterium]